MKHKKLVKGIELNLTKLIKMNFNHFEVYNFKKNMERG